MLWLTPAHTAKNLSTSQRSRNLKCRLPLTNFHQAICLSLVVLNVKNLLNWNRTALYPVNNSPKKFPSPPVADHLWVVQGKLISPPLHPLISPGWPMARCRNKRLLETHPWFSSWWTRALGWVQLEKPIRMKDFYRVFLIHLTTPLTGCALPLLQP